MKTRNSLAALAAALFFATASSAIAESRNGFDVTGALVPLDEILQGGPPKDGIPSIDRPVFIPASRASWLRPTDTVLALERGGVAKAYPIRIMNWHEVVNDRFGDEAIAVTFCPLCGSGMAFKSAVGGRTLSFGVSGLLYNSDVLLYDRETQSLWSQIAAKAFTGSMKGTQLEAVPLAHTTWADWRARHPNSLVLSTETGYVRDYGRDPYAGYAESERTFFPVKMRGEGFHPKERVLGVTVGTVHKAYPFVELAKRAGTGKGATLNFDDVVGGRPLKIRYSPQHQSAEAFGADGKPIAATTLFWFAWYAFHPSTEVYRAR